MTSFFEHHQPDSVPAEKVSRHGRAEISQGATSRLEEVAAPDGGVANSLRSAIVMYGDRVRNEQPLTVSVIDRVPITSQVEPPKEVQPSYAGIITAAKQQGTSVGSDGGSLPDQFEGEYLDSSLEYAAADVAPKNAELPESASQLEDGVSPVNEQPSQLTENPLDIAAIRREIQEIPE